MEYLCLFYFSSAIPFLMLWIKLISINWLSGERKCICDRRRKRDGGMDGEFQKRTEIREQEEIVERKQVTE